MTEIFPILLSDGWQEPAETGREALPLYRDVLWGPAKDSDNPAGHPFEAAGEVVACEPMEGAQLRVTSEITAPTDTIKLYHTGKNLLPPQQGSKTVRGVTYTVEPDQSIRVKGQAALGTGASYYLDAGTIKLDRGAWLSGVAEGSGVAMEAAYSAPSGGTFFAYDRGQGAAIPAKEIGQLCISVPAGRRVDTVVRPQLELGDRGTAWEAPRQAIYTADLGRTVEAGEYDWDTGLLTITAPVPEAVQLESQMIPAIGGINVLRSTSPLRVQGTAPGGKAEGNQLQAIWSAAGPVMAEGAEALRGWIWRALSTARKAWPVYSHDYGSDLETLVGRPYTQDVRQSEAIRLVREALEPCPYITDVEQTEVSFEGSTITIHVVVDTIYGEVSTDVRA